MPLHSSIADHQVLDGEHSGTNVDVPIGVGWWHNDAIRILGRIHVERPGLLAVPQLGYLLLVFGGRVRAVELVVRR